MNALREVLILAALMSVAFWVYSLVMPLIVDYKFSTHGIDIILFRCWSVFRLKRENIKRVTIQGLFERAGRLTIFWIRLNNRIKRRTLVVETTGLSLWTLSPSDPDAAVRNLGMSSRRSR